MFTPIHLLPRFDPKEAHRYQMRWKDSATGHSLREKILAMIRAGAGEDFLQWDFEHGQLGFLESMWDLKGIDIFDEDITFPKGDNFEGIDFTFAEFYHSKFREACFPETAFNFAKIFNCEFHDCLFAFTSFYGTTLEKVKFFNCDFVEHNSFTNCDFVEVNFTRWHAPRNIFVDCKFDESTTFEDPVTKPIGGFRGEDLTPDRVAELFKGFKEGYLTGGVLRKGRYYFFKERQWSTRYNTQSSLSRAAGYIQEYLTGYGVKPQRVLGAMLTVFLASFLVFSAKLGFSTALLLTAGAFFTFGASAELLTSIDPVYKFLYILTSFAGISLTALFVTVLANVWFKER